MTNINLHHPIRQFPNPMHIIRLHAHGGRHAVLALPYELVGDHARYIMSLPFEAQLAACI